MPPPHATRELLMDSLLFSAAEHAEEPTALGIGPGGWVALSMIAVILLML